MIIYEPPKAPNKIPLIDISDFYSNDLEKQKSIAWELHKAARETGFFYVEGHKVVSDQFRPSFPGGATP